MNMQHIKKPGLLKNLAVLSVALQLSACGGLDDAVSSSSTGTVTVRWVAPEVRTDGNGLALSEIGGYRVYFGEVSGDYPNRINISDGSAVEGTVTAPRGTYFYVITAYDTLGRESEFWPEVEIQI